jgi:hypothetical protein
MQNPTGYIFPIVIIAIAIFLRIRRSIGFQRYRPAAAIFRIVICVMILTVLLSFAINFHPDTLIYSGAGMAGGLIMAFFGAKNVIIEQRKSGIYFRTHIWIEIGILAIFFARLLYRFYNFTSTMGNVPPEQITSQLRYEKDPVTGVIISVFCTYYIGYFIYILFEVNRFKKANNIQ